jgi:hypothetical protein
MVFVDVKGSHKYQEASDAYNYEDAYTDGNFTHDPLPLGRTSAANFILMNFEAAGLAT